MPETDAEDRDLADERADLADGVVDGGRVARTVRQEHAVGLTGQDVGRGRRRRYDLDGCDLAEVTQDRGLDAEVVGDHSARARTGEVRRARGDQLGQIGSVGAGLVERGLLQRGLVGRAERTRHGAGLADVTRESAGIDTRDPGDTVADEEVVEAFLATPVAAAAGQVANDHAAANGRAASLSAALAP